MLVTDGWPFYKLNRELMEEKLDITEHLGKYTREDLNEKVIISKLPKEIISIVYDKDDNVLFGSHKIKGKVSYHYLDGKFTKNGNPLFLHSEVLYDGIGNSDLPENTITMNFKDIKAMFI